MKNMIDRDNWFLIVHKPRIPSVRKNKYGYIEICFVFCTLTLFMKVL